MPLHRGISLCLSALLIGACISDVHAQTRRRARPAPPPPPAPSADKPSQATRLQIDVFQLATTGDQLVRLNVDQLSVDQGTGKPLAAAEVLKRLGELGTARLSVRIDTVADLSAEIELVCGKRVPTIAGMNIRKGGKSVPSVNYEDVSFRASIIGSWREGTAPAVGHIQCGIRFSTAVPSSVDVGEGVTLPTLANFNIEQKVRLISARPVLIVANDMAVPTDPKGQTSVMVIRLTATRQTEFDRVARQAANEQTMIQMLAIELTGDEESLEELDVKGIAPAGADAKAVIDALGTVGKAEVISRPSVMVIWPNTASITSGDEVPIVSDVKTATDGTVTPKVDYRQIGLKLDFTGQWLDPQRASVQVAMTHTSVYETKIGGSDDIKLPALRERKTLLANDAVRAGECCWLVGPVWPTENGQAHRIFLGLTARRVGATGE